MYTEREKNNMGRSEKEIVALMMPIYYVDIEVTNADIDLARSNWQMLIENTATPFLDGKKAAQTPVEFGRLEGTSAKEYASSLSMFFDVFYLRLFDIHPLCRPLFSNIQIQGRFLVKMIALCLSMNEDPKSFKLALHKLTEVHNIRGVKSGEYGIMGEVLFWALRKCLGVHVFNNAAHLVWVKILSAMLRHMVPVAVAYELKTKGVNQKARLQKITLFEGITDDRTSSKPYLNSNSTKISCSSPDRSRIILVSSCHSPVEGGASRRGSVESERARRRSLEGENAMKCCMEEGIL